MNAGKVVTEFLYRPANSKRASELRIPVRCVQVVDREKVHLPSVKPDYTASGPYKRPKKFDLRGRTESVTFVVSLDSPKKINLKCTDIEILRRAVFAELDKDYEMKWMPHLLVKVNEGMGVRWADKGEGVEVCLENIELGKTPEGEDVYWTYRSGEWTVWKGKPDLSDRRGESKALIEATPQNVAALNSFLSRLNKLRERIKTFLNPENIESTLTNVKLLALPDGSNNGDDISSNRGSAGDHVQHNRVGNERRLRRGNTATARMHGAG